MKLTKTILKQIIKEEMQKVLQGWDREFELGPGDDDWIADLMAPALRANRAAAARAAAGHDEGRIDPNSPEAARAAGRKADIESGLAGPGEYGGSDTLEAGEQWDDPTGRAIALGNMSWDARRRAINNALKAGKIDKNEWNRLRRKNWAERPKKLRKRKRK